MQIKYIFLSSQKIKQNVYLDLEFKVPMIRKGIHWYSKLHAFPNTTFTSEVTKELPAAYKLPAAAAADGEAVHEVAAISSLPAVAAEGLCFAAEAAEEAPGPVNSQGWLQVSVLLKGVSRNLH